MKLQLQKVLLATMAGVSLLSGCAPLVVGGAVVNGYTPTMELANLLTPLFASFFVVGLIWKHRYVQMGVLAAAYAGFIYYALNFIPEL